MNFIYVWCLNPGEIKMLFRSSSATHYLINYAKINLKAASAGIVWNRNWRATFHLKCLKYLVSLSMLCWELRCCQEASSLPTEPSSQQIWLSWGEKLKSWPVTFFSPVSWQHHHHHPLQGNYRGDVVLAAGSQAGCTQHNTTLSTSPLLFCSLTNYKLTSIVNQNIINKDMMSVPPCELIGIVWRWQLMLCCCRRLSLFTGSQL